MHIKHFKESNMNDYSEKNINNELKLIQNKDKKINDVEFEINCIEDQSILIIPYYPLSKPLHKIEEILVICIFFFLLIF